MSEEQEHDDQIFRELGELPLATRTMLPIVNEEAEAEIRREEQQEKEAEKATTSTGDVEIEAKDLEELESILKIREAELLARGITKDTIERELALARASWTQQLDEERRQREAEEERAKTQQAEDQRVESEEALRARQTEDERRQSEAERQTGTPQRVKQCARRRPGPYRDMQEQQEREAKRQKFRSAEPPWANQARAPPPPPITKKKRRWRPGTVALREIKKYQKSTDPILPKAPFSRVVREVMEKFSDRADRIQGSALEALQEASEDVLVSVFQDSVLCMAHAKRVTTKPVDMSLALRLRLENCLHPQ